jgi:hypothetical protein
MPKAKLYESGAVSGSSARRVPVRGIGGRYTARCCDGRGRAFGGQETRGHGPSGGSPDDFWKGVISQTTTYATAYRRRGCVAADAGPSAALYSFARHGGAALPLLARRRHFCVSNVSGLSSLLRIAQDRLA